MPEDEENKVAGWLSKLNLPQLILGRAGNAISEIIGSAIDIPKAGIERVSTKIRAETARQVEFDDKIHAKATELALGDEAFVSRALDNAAKRLLKGQYNREKVAQIALQNLEEDGVENASLDDEALSEDWLNNFSAYTEKVSDEEIQQLWGNVLAGEIRHPGKYSLATLRLLSVVDKQTAEKISKHLNHEFGGGLVVNNTGTPNKRGNIELDYLELQALGVIVGVGNSFSKTLPKINNFHLFPYINRTNLIVYPKESVSELTVPILALTQVGKELLTLLPKKSPHEMAEHLKGYIEGKFEKIVIIHTPDAKKPNEQIIIGEVLP